MSVVADIQPAPAVGPERLVRLLRQNEDRLFTIGLALVIVATTGLAAALNVAGMTAEVGVCHQQASAVHIFLTMH
jgi:hypothetical protein